MGSDLVPCLSLHFLGLSQEGQLYVFCLPGPGLCSPLGSLLRALLGTFEHSSGQAFPVPSPGMPWVPSRTFALRNSSWSKPTRWEGSQYGFHQTASPHRASTLPLMWPKFASDVLGTLHPAIEVNSWGPEFSNMIPLAVKMLLSLPSRADLLGRVSVWLW